MNLTCEGIPNYLPKTLKRKERRRINDNKPIPYFDAYIFANLIEGVHDFPSIKKMDCVIDIIRTGDHYSIVPDYVIDTLKSMEDEHHIIRTSYEHYQDGEKVRFKDDHKFALREGLIKVSLKKRIFVLMEIMGKQQHIEVLPQEIEPVI